MNLDSSYLFDYIRNLYSLYSYDNKTGKIKMPFRYILELTYRCNLRCPFCYIDKEEKIEELTVDEWINIIEQIPPLKLISFVAGEVLLKEGFDIIFKKASEKYRKTTLITNGLLLNESISDFLVKNKLMLLSVSLDAIGEKHDAIRNHNGLYNKIIDNLAVFNDKRKRKYSTALDIKTCVLENNLDDLPLLYKKAIGLNAQFFSLTFIRKQHLRQNSILFDEFTDVFYEKKYPIELYFDMEHFKEIYKELESISKRTKTILRYAPRFNPRGDMSRIETFFNSADKSVQKLYNPCTIPMTGVYITPQGFLYPCLSYKVADLKEVSLKEAINSVKYKCFRKNLYHSKIFNACQMCCDAIPRNQ